VLNEIHKVIISTPDFTESFDMRKLNFRSVKWRQCFYVLLCLIPIVVFFGMIWKYALNIPFWDDYDAVLLFLVKYSDTSTFFEKFKLVFSQHNEHRIVFNRLVTLGQFYLNGTVDFRHLIFIGNIGLIGVLGVLYHSLKVKKHKLLFLVPIAFLLFQPQYWENINWAMASLQNFYVIFFAFLSLLLVSKKGKGSLFGGLLFAILATFTQGNGMFVFPVGLGILLYQRRYKALPAWVLATLMCLLFYFNDYIQPAQHPSITEALYHPVRTLHYFFSFIGSSLGFNNSSSLLIGMGVTAYFFAITVKKYFKRNTLVYGLFCFLFISAAAAAATRSGFGIEQAFASRYSIVSILFYILIYMSLIEIFPKLKKHIVFFIFTAISFNIYAYFSHVDSIVEQHNALSESVIEWEASGQGLLFPDREGANQRMMDAIDKGIYTF
jgi:hypothetical protein